MKHILWLFLLVLSFSAFSASQAEADEKLMDNAMLDSLIKRFDQTATADRPGFWLLSYEGMTIYVVTDEGANRMRVMTQVANAEKLEKQHLHRLMQSNFDSALDARYAIGKGVVWSAFIHPLASLSEYEFFSGLAQVITLAKTYGTSFSSGALTYSGGDSRAEQEKLYQLLLKKGLSV